MASLSLRLRVSRYDPSWIRVTGGVATIGEGTGDARLKLLRDSLLRGRAVRSTVSGREGGTGAGEVGRLEGLKKDGFRSVSGLIIVCEVSNSTAISECSRASVSEV